MYLFLDSSFYIQVGLLNEDLTWAHHELVQNKKGSHVLHSIIYSALSEKGIKVDDLKGIFLANGPGSYTGIRVAEGISQVLEMEGMPVYSFYNFEVPAFCQIEEYDFFSEAFKGEVFHYQYKGGEEKFSLIKEETFKEMDHSSDHSYHLDGEVLEVNLSRMYDLFKPHSVDIFSRVLKRAKHLPPYYYRPEEKEFNMPKGR